MQASFRTRGFVVHENFGIFVLFLRVSGTRNNSQLSAFFLSLFRPRTNSGFLRLFQASFNNLQWRTMITMDSKLPWHEHDIEDSGTSSSRFWNEFFLLKEVREMLG
ncbi:uncharacterized protein LOC110695728 [Chenopodium quinoa]|uniref:uncharacterized protein LOC110695728 n=1 Tax=Chenopodium quinoa TaxID=63459 RepID=UPI000B77A346|nr:uncharacterized protein LOC110695728 [Chenopodium quinoa]